MNRIRSLIAVVALRHGIVHLKPIRVFEIKEAKKKHFFVVKNAFWDPELF